MTDGLEAVPKVTELQPDLILLDIGTYEAEWNRGRTPNPQTFPSVQNIVRGQESPAGLVQEAMRA